MTDWSLEDVEESARRNPTSFFIPSLQERQSQKPGDPVRLHFALVNPTEEMPGAERMWVEVETPLDASGRYTGVLTNRPAFIKGIAQGDLVTFEPRHIARTFIRKGDPRWIDCADKMALVSEMVFQEGEMLRFAYREKADREEDSGWRFFTGHEDDAYTNDPENIRICVVGWLLDFDPTIDAFIREKDGAAFERQTREAGWKRATDWSPPT